MAAKPGKLDRYSTPNARRYEKTNASRYRRRLESVALRNATDFDSLDMPVRVTQGWNS